MRKGEKAKKRLKTVAVIPAFNEAKRVGSVVRETKKYVDEVLVVDDGSRDKTQDVAERAGAKVLKLPANMGVGFATRVGADYALTRLGAGVIVFIDADGQHPPERIPLLLKKLDDGFGAAFASRSEQIRSMPLIKRFGNGVLTFATNLFSGGTFMDTQTGFRAFTSSAWDNLKLGSDRYEICSEIAWEAAKKGIKYCEVPIPANYDEWTTVKGTDVVTGFKIFVKLLWWRLTRWN